jgi:hypothetical protein
LKAYAETCGKLEVAISGQPAEGRRGLGRESARF